MSFLSQASARFARNESGAVTVEFLVLTASVVMLAFAVRGPIHEGLVALIASVSSSLEAIDLLSLI